MTHTHPAGSCPAVKLVNVAKRFEIDTTRGGRSRYGSLREDVTRWLTTPWRRLRGERATPRESFWALRDVSFTVAPGEVVGLIGRNGAGKSTLLKILSRITEPTAGRVELHGRVGSLLEVGVGFHPELTGRENIYLNGAILGMRRAEIARQFDEIVAFAETEKFLDTPVKRYSSGMYMRLAFAVAAHLDPEILLVDEVLAVGDAAFQKKCLGKMQEVARGGRTVLFVSHNMGAVTRLCQRVVVLEQGEVRDEGHEVAAVVRRYLADESLHLRGEWRNRGEEYANPYFQPLRLRLRDEAGNTITHAIGNNEVVFVSLEGRVQQPAGDLGVGYTLTDNSGQLLYWTHHTDAVPTARPLPVGLVCLESRLPPHLLNEGMYRLELLGSLHCRAWLFEPGKRVPALTLAIQGGLSESPMWLQPRPGLLAPVLEWHLHGERENMG